MVRDGLPLGISEYVVFAGVVGQVEELLVWAECETDVS